MLPWLPTFLEARLLSGAERDTANHPGPTYPRAVVKLGAEFAAAPTQAEILRCHSPQPKLLELSGREGDVKAVQRVLDVPSSKDAVALAASRAPDVHDWVGQAGTGSLQREEPVTAEGSVLLQGVGWEAGTHFFLLRSEENVVSGLWPQERASSVCQSGHTGEKYLPGSLTRGSKGEAAWLEGR